VRPEEFACLSTEHESRQLPLALPGWWQQVVNPRCAQLDSKGAVSPRDLGPQTSNINDYASIKSLLENK